MEYFRTSPELDSMWYRGLGNGYEMIAKEDLQPFPRRSENLQCAKLPVCINCIVCKRILICLLTDFSIQA